MTSLTSRIFWRKCNYNALRDFNILRPANTYLHKCKQSTKPQVAEEEGVPLIDPLKHPDFFQVHNLFTVKDLFDAKVHYGHKEGSMNKNMLPFIYGSRLGHLIIDLDQTAELLREALNFTAHIAFRDGIILFFSRNPQSSYMVDTVAKECHQFSHTRYWRSGTFTNSTAQYGIVTRLPDLCIFLSTKDGIFEHEAVTHSAKMCIPTVGIVDTNSNPNLITFPVPGNDDSLSAIQLYCRLFKEAIFRGQRAREMIEKKSQ